MGKYDDIMHLPHHVSPTRAQMPMRDRAAQFSPFAALTGYDETILETARRTEERVSLDENALAILDMKFQLIAEHLQERPEVVFTYFVPDEKKDGGAYVEVTGTVKKVDTLEREIVLNSGLRIPMDEIRDMQGELFSR